MDSIPIYALRAADVYRSLETSPNGLDPSEVQARQSLYGSNILSHPVYKPAWQKFGLHLIHPMAIALWVAGSIAFFARQFELGIVIWIVVLINASFSFWREHRAEQAISTLQRLLPTYARIVRSGVETLINTSEVVPGDVLVLAEGDNIPADARVVEEYGLRSNNSTLTGEAVPARKTADASLRDGISELERPNLIFAGTSVVSGTGRAVVFATGMHTQFGRIASLTQEVQEGPSPLQRELAKITRVLALVAIIVGAIVFSVGLTHLGHDWINAFLLGVGAVVAILPEGLPAILTLSLAAASQRLGKQDVLVKKLATIETLGYVSIVATDKSGTLTQNQMTVREIWVAGQRLSVTGVGYEPAGEFSPIPSGPSLHDDLTRLLAAATLCNNARILPPSPEKPGWSSLGDQTEAALKVVAMKAGLVEPVLNNHFQRVHEIPFDARRKRMSTIHKQRQTYAQAALPDIAFIKGAPREILGLCTQILINGEIIPLQETERELILQTIDEYSRGALRVLGLAQRELPPRAGRSSSVSGPYYSVERVEKDLTFLGLLAMMDPPRPEVARAVKILQGAGIRLVMITGDYGLTAESLARRVGLLTETNPIILTGAELDALDNHQLNSLINKEVIYARMAPENKLRLVSAFQAQGHVVAVTGDGVNDAPALRKADVGVSMGIIGTDVAKEAADVILITDNFAALARAIAEGRAISDNLRKFITYIFSSNVPEILPFIITASTAIHFTWTVLQMLAIDLGTDLFPALALGTEKPEPVAMRRPPRRRDAPLLNSGLIIRSFLWLGLIEALLCYCGYIALYGFSGNIALLNSPYLVEIPFPQLFFVPQANIDGLATTVFFAGVVMAQVGNAFATRTERARGRWVGWLSNRTLLLGVAFEIAIALILIYTPLNRVFSLSPLPASYWVWLALYAPVLYSLDWIRKMIIRRRQNIQSASKVILKQ